MARINGTSGNDTLDGTSGDDTITNGTGNDTVFGGDGDDWIFDGAGNDTLFGGDGDDTFDVDEEGENDIIVGGETSGDFDTVTFLSTNSTEGVEITYTGNEEGSFSLTGTSTAGTFSEIETFILTDHDDYVDASASWSGAAGDKPGIMVDAQDGDDTVIGGNGGDTIDGGAGNDSIEGGYGDDTLTGGAGDDTFSGGSGNDAVYGGGDDDWIDGGIEGDYLYGGSGGDKVEGGDGDDTVYGGAGDDSLSGDDGNDILYGDTEQINLIENGSFSDGLTGWTVNNPTGGVGIRTTASKANFNSANESTYGDSIQQDFVSEVGETHTLSLTLSEVGGGSDGAHTFQIDIIDDAGNVIASETHTVGDAQSLPISFDFTSTTENATLLITNTTSTDSVSTDGRVDNVSIVPSDTDQGNDEIHGGLGDDTIYGGGGNDTIEGGEGNDTLTGGDGDDTFGLAQGSGDDVITDFDVGDADRDGTFNDQLDVSGLQNPDGSPITASDVVVQDDGSGNAKLIFPEGESLVLHGVAPSEISSASQLNAAGIPCFTPGAMIATAQGERAIETLQVGDKVMTRDHGMQAIRWIGQRTVAGHDTFAPILIKPGVVTGLHKPLLVSPQHRMLFAGYRAELLFGESEVLVATKHLVDGRDVIRQPSDGVTYIHMLFDNHEVVYANGAATESFHPGGAGIAAVDGAAREELFAIFPELRSDLTQYGRTARRCLRKHEAQMVQM